MTLGVSPKNLGMRMGSGTSNTGPDTCGGNPPENSKGSAAAADPLVGQVPPGGGYDPPGGFFGGSKLGSLGVFKPWDTLKNTKNVKM